MDIRSFSRRRFLILSGALIALPLIPNAISKYCSMGTAALIARLPMSLRDAALAMKVATWRGKRLQMTLEEGRGCASLYPLGAIQKIVIDDHEAGNVQNLNGWLIPHSAMELAWLIGRQEKKNEIR
jgi:hypothetical protein